MADISIVAEPFELTLWQRGNSTIYPPPEVNSDLNITIDCGDDDEIAEHGTITLSILGTYLNVNIAADPFIISTSITSDEDIVGLLPTTSIFSLSLSISGDVTVEAVKKNWLRWSDIGHLDFTIAEDNVAGTAPLDWAGWVYDSRKLGDKIVVYGENGVTLLTPTTATYGGYTVLKYGMQTIYRIGVKNKGAVGGDESRHFFIDTIGQLFKVDDKLERLGYNEYLSSMINPILTWDAEKNLLYICDGLTGYIYSPDNKSMGSGPVNITGIGSRDGTKYVLASGTITTPPFNWCSDIYDFGTRKNKTITGIEIGIDLVNTLYASIDYKLDKAGSFRSIPWSPVNPNAITYIRCFGVEFMIRLKTLTYEYFVPDYINIIGEIQDYSYLDSLRSMEGS